VGTSENAVYIQIWTALIGILLYKYIQKKAKYNWNLSNLVNFIRLNIFVKIDLWKWADDPFISGKPPIKRANFSSFNSKDRITYKKLVKILIIPK
jgi:hypothetical protein